MTTHEGRARLRALWGEWRLRDGGDLFASSGQAVVERVGVAGEDVLDIATGTGNTALAAKRAGARRVVGVDVTPELLAIAAARAGGRGSRSSSSKATCVRCRSRMRPSGGCCRRSG